MKCDCCQKAIAHYKSFKGELKLTFQGEKLSFMGEAFKQPSFDIEIVVCEHCAIVLMTKNKGILIDG